MSSPHYSSGQEIHDGDRVRHMGQPGRIAFVIERKEFLPEFPAEQWSHYQRGFMVQEDRGQLFMYEKADEDLQLAE